MRNLVAAFLFSFIAFSAFAQRDKAALNIAKFDYRKYHFGFTLCGNQSSFFLNFFKKTLFFNPLITSNIKYLIKKLGC